MQQCHNWASSKFSLKFSLKFSFPMLFIAALFVGGCQGLQTRDDISGGKKQSGRTASEPQRTGDTHTSQAPAPFPPSTVPVAPSQPDVTAEGADALPKAPAPQGPAGPDSFLSKELPKVGVILGPGGLKTYAHIGVLREFARARVPIHAIAGLEWGAMMGAFYAEKGLANDVDWKAFRMKDSDLPSAGLIRDYHARSMGEFDSYLSIVFPGGSLERAKVPFGCPTVVKRDRLQFLSKGATKEIVARCMPYPPLLAAAGDNIAAPDAVEEAAQWLRSQGANLIVLVNVLGAGETLSGKLAEEQYGTSVLWTEIRRHLLKSRAPTVNWIVSVNTVGKAVDDLGARRANVELGAKAAMDLTTKLSKQYGF